AGADRLRPRPASMHRDRRLGARRCRPRRRRDHPTTKETTVIQTTRRKLLIASVGSAAAGIGVPLAARAQGAAQGWPKGPVRIVVPNVPGGALDILARLLESELSATWKQPIVVEFKPGAGTLTGT